MEELREAVERYIREYLDFAPDLRSTAAPIAEQLRAIKAKRAREEKMRESRPVNLSF